MEQTFLETKRDEKLPPPASTKSTTPQTEFKGEAVRRVLDNRMGFSLTEDELDDLDELELTFCQMSEQRAQFNRDEAKKVKQKAADDYRREPTRENLLKLQDIEVNVARRMMEIGRTVELALGDFYREKCIPVILGILRRILPELQEFYDAHAETEQRFADKVGLPWTPSAPMQAVARRLVALKRHISSLESLPQHDTRAGKSPKAAIREYIEI